MGIPVCERVYVCVSMRVHVWESSRAKGWIGGMVGLARNEKEKNIV